MISRNWLGVLAVALLVAGCDHATAPSLVTEGIIVFADREFSGTFKLFISDVKDLEDVDGGCLDGGSATSAGDIDWGDCVSSIRIAPGWKATIYKDDSYEGKSLTITSDVANLKNLPGPCGDDWDDCVSSIRVSRQ
jgi:hypothetical protein